MIDEASIFRTVPLAVRAGLPSNAPLSRWRSARSVRVPVTLQVDSAGCAAACIDMVLRFAGRAAKRQDDSNDASLSGMTARRMVEVLIEAEMGARGISVPDAYEGQLPVPAVLHWNFQHYVVLESLGKRSARIVDPAHGRMRVPRRLFDASFTGVAVICDTIERGNRRAWAVSPTWRRYFDLLPAVKGEIIGVVALSTLLQLLGFATPLITVEIVERVIPSGDVRSLSGIVGLSVLWLFGVLAFGAARAYALTRIQAVFDARAIGGFLAHVFSLPHRFFQQRSVGDVVSRVQSNVAMRDAVTNQVISIALDVPLALAYIVLLARFDSFIALATLLMAALSGAGAMIGARVVQPYMAREVHFQARMQSLLVDALRSIGWIKASGAEERLVARAEYVLQSQIAAAKERQMRAGLIQVGLDALRQGTTVLLLLIGAWSALNGTLTVGHLFGAISLAVAALTPLSSLTGVAQYLARLAPQVTRLDDVWSRPKEAEAFGNATPTLEGAIRLDRCSYEPRAAGRRVVEDVTLSVRPGEFVAIVGPSGAGKSSLAGLLTCAIRPTSGRVFVGDLDVSETSITHVRRQIGVVTQNAPLFQASIRDNIAVFTQQVSQEAIEEAAERAGVHDDILRMPLGYDTVLFEGGANVSGGQRQRLAIARAVLGHPSVLLLDEATSEVDSTTEERIYGALSALPSTRIVITHRLATTRNADRIVVMEDGRMVGIGRHAELLGSNAWYARTCAQQGLWLVPESRG